MLGRLLARDLRHGKQWVSLPFSHILVLDLVGLIGNFETVEQLVPPELSFSRFLV